MRDLNKNEGINYIFDRIDSKAGRKYFHIELALALTLFAISFATPAYHYINIAFQDINWKATYQKADNLLDPLNNLPPESHGAKKVFRFTVPLIIKVFSLNSYLVYTIQFIIGIVIYILIYKLSQKITKDNVSAVLLTFGLSFIYFGKAAFVDIYSWFDAWAYFFLILTIFFSNPVIIFLTGTLAAWTDERAVMILPAIILFHSLNNKNQVFKFAISKQVVVSSLLLIGYLICRFVLFYFYNLKTPNESANLLRAFEQTDFWGFGIWTFLEGLWILVIYSLYLLTKEKKYFTALLLVVPILWFVLVANAVNDITRSGNYLVPLLFVFLLYLSRVLNTAQLRVLLFIGAVVSFIFPAYYIITDVKPYFLWYKPIFVRLIDYLILNNYI